MKYLLVGPVIGPVHGQSLAFTRFIESIEIASRIVVDTNLESKSKIAKVIYTFSTLLAIFVKAVFCKYDILYFTCSRSLLGSIKDILLINIVSLKNKKIINHLHGSDFYDFLHTCPNWYKKILIHSYNKVGISIVLLERMKEQFNDFENMKVEVVSNFYDKELERNLGTKEREKINLVYLSNIMCSKGIFDLITAFKELTKINDNIHLTIAGGFIADKYMSIDKVKVKFLSEINNNKDITYLGKVFGDQKVELLQKSDIFVLPTYYESEAFPISIIEAMACGNAIVTTNYKYLPDVISNSSGILIEPKSVTSLVKGIETLLNDVESLRALQTNNKLLAKEKYSIESYINNLKKIVC